MTDKADNMKIWDAVQTTDPSQTKEVTFGRKFTAIDAHSQIMNATKQFGPVGAGWGYETDYGFQNIGEHHVMIWCDLKLWWSTSNPWEGMVTPSKYHTFGPVRGMALITAKDQKKLPDNDASKKAMTDALTKALSHLGFNADVFLGKFDDNKYVAELKKNASREEIAAQEKYAENRTAFIKDIKAAKDADGIDTAQDKHKEWVATLDPATALEMSTWVSKQKKELNDGSE